jgi:predicted PurR-regulated permease PerM
MNNTGMGFNSGRANFFLMVLICCILTGAVLKIAASVILPFTIATLLAFVMYPLVKGLDTIRCPRLISIFLAVSILITGLIIIGMVFVTSGRMIIAQYPKYERRLTDMYVWAARFFELSYNENLSFFENIWGQLGIRAWIRSFTFSSSGIFFNFLQTAVLIILFVVFILLETSYFKEKLEAAFAKRSISINKMAQDVITRVTRYLAAKFLFSLANGVIFAVSFHFVGLEFAIFWGLIQFLLNFIPALGSIASGTAISFFALIQFWPEPGPVILVIFIVLTVNIILGNILDPKIIGEHVGISPLMVLVSIVIWGYIWGFAGMVLAVPMTVIIKIICENIPIMESVSILIGSRKSAQAKKSEYSDIGRGMEE